uniref:Pectate lyase n=1 Tax=Populus alba TaxID=43335 RepID=A0A4U5QY51_POPAL|nr:hypothetical protein D5086_0000026710 [Populus alba]
MQTSTPKAGIANFDEYWKKRAEEAKEASREAYEPNPEKVAEHFNYEVHKSLEGGNSTRRNLGKYKGPCLATNPIDQCWRCDKNWAKNRKKLGGCALGFGRKTIGGMHGKYYRVTDPSDNDMVNPKPGTLRYGVIQDEPLWIIFAHDMAISLICEKCDHPWIHIHGAKAGNGGMIRDSVDHYGFRSRSDGDGISIFGSTDIWIDHISMSNCEDGLIDAVMGSNAITISNCHFTKHNDVMLLGASDSYSGDSVMQITVAFNHFGRGLVQRMRGQHPTIISQGNRFIAPSDPACKELKVCGSPGIGDQRGICCSTEPSFVQSGNAIKTMNKPGVINAKPGGHVSMLTRFSGALDCVRGRPC